MHEIIVETFIYISCLSTILDVWVETITFNIVRALKERFQKLNGIIMILSDIVDVDSACNPVNHIECQVKTVMQVFQKTCSLLISSIENYLLNHGSFLIVNEA